MARRPRSVPVLSLLVAVLAAVPLAVISAGTGAAAPPAAADPVALTTPAPVPPSPTPSADPLRPLPAPGRPLATEIASDSAMINWTAPAGPVFRYTIEYLTADGWRAWTAGPTNSHRMINLTPATAYTIRVWAAPLAGSGYSVSPPSEPASFTTLPTGSTPTPAPTGLTCRLTFTIWSTGFVMNITITNPTTQPIGGWTGTFRVSGTTRITQVWSVNLSQSGDRVTLRPGWSAPPIPPGGSITIGVIGSYTGTFVPPTEIEVNGYRCHVV